MTSDGNYAGKKNERTKMTTRELIKTIRDCKTGTDECNALLEECAKKIEDFLGGDQTDHRAE